MSSSPANSPLPGELGQSIDSPIPLTQEHATGEFRCGEPEPDRFLEVSALNRQKAMLSRTYVSLCAGDVAGYFTLVHIQLTASQILSRLSPKLARGMPFSIPAITMARLAVDERFQRRGLGESLFADALKRTWSVVESGAAPVRFFVVDAKHEKAKAFYLKLGVKPLADDSLRLYFSYKQIEAALQNESGLEMESPPQLLGVSRTKAYTYKYKGEHDDRNQIPT